MPFQDLFKQVHNLPSIPKVVQELIDNFNSPNASADEIAKKIQLDQSLSLKVLRLANSARYGAGRKINSIDSAVVLLGFEAVKTLVIASGVTSACKSIPGLDQGRFWRCSFTVASICKLIAKEAKKDPEMAYTCGMLHNIGDALMYLVHKEKMQRIDSLLSYGSAKAELERNQFGYDFMQAGAELTRRWNFPQAISDAILNQGNPQNDPAHDYAQIVSVATSAFYLFDADKNQQEFLNSLPTEKLKAMGVDLLSFMEGLVQLLGEDDDILAMLE